MSNPNVCFIRPELTKLLPLYNLIRDVLSGETAIKAEGKKYLPMPKSCDTSAENRAYYDAYKTRAVFYNASRRTLNGLVGQVFTKDPNIKIPENLKLLQENATGSGVNLNQLAKKALSLTLAYSRCGLFVDYPATGEDGAASKADLESGRIRPTLYVYSPLNIINWRTKDIGAEEVLSLVVIWELFCFADDGFEMKNAAQIRVLRLDNDNNVVHEIWREPTPSTNNGGKNPKGNYQRYESFMPKDANGNNLKQIPFMFIGSDNNDQWPDNPNFYDICSLNVAHYRNSADYEQSCFLLGQPTPYFTGLTEEWAETVLKGKVEFGSSTSILLPKDATAGMLEATPNQLIKDAMDTKEKQMVALGAKLVEQKQIQRTATEAVIENASETSVLSSCAKNVSAAFQWGLKTAEKYLSTSESEIIYELNSDFDFSKLKPEERKQLVEEWQKGAISWEEMRKGLRRAGSATEDDAVAKESIKRAAAEELAMIATTQEITEPKQNDN